MLKFNTVGDPVFSPKGNPAFRGIYQPSKSTYKYPKNMEMRKDEYTYRGWAGGLNRNDLSKKRERDNKRVKG